jgi:hypothetical protein
MLENGMQGEGILFTSPLVEGGRMRGTVSKRLRKQIYGEQSIKQKRRYVKEVVEKVVESLFRKDKDGECTNGIKLITVKRVIIKNIGLRQEYRDAKRDYYRGDK